MSTPDPNRIEPHSSMPYWSLDEADVASRERPEGLGKACEGKTENRSVTLPHPHGAYQLTFNEIPVELLDEAEISQLIKIADAMNSFAKQPLRHLFFECYQNGGFYKEFSIEGKPERVVLLGYQPGVSFEDFKATLEHEMGHHLAREGTSRRDWNAPMIGVLSVLGYTFSAFEVIDDSNYRPSPDSSGHPQDGSEGIDGSAIHAFLQCDQMMHYLDLPSTSELTRFWGKAVFLYLKEHYFAGNDFCRYTSPVPWESDNFDSFLGPLVILAQEKIANDLVGATPSDLGVLADHIWWLDQYASQEGIKHQLVRRCLELYEKVDMDGQREIRYALEIFYPEEGFDLCDANIIKRVSDDDHLPVPLRDQAKMLEVSLCKENSLCR